MIAKGFLSSFYLPKNLTYIWVINENEIEKYVHSEGSEGRILDHLLNKPYYRRDLSTEQNISLKCCQSVEQSLC